MPASTGARVLTVEDDPIVRADLSLILEDHGFDVCADARDGAEAVDLARTHRPDLILIDLNLPELDGVEATRRIMDEREVPIVAFTGYAGDSIERAVEAVPSRTSRSLLSRPNSSTRCGTCSPSAGQRRSERPIIIKSASRSRR